MAAESRRVKTLIFLSFFICLSSICAVYTAESVLAGNPETGYIQDFESDSWTPWGTIWDSEGAGSKFYVGGERGYCWRIDTTGKANGGEVDFWGATASINLSWDVPAGKYKIGLDICLPEAAGEGERFFGMFLCQPSDVVFTSMASLANFQVIDNAIYFCKGDANYDWDFSAGVGLQAGKWYRLEAVANLHEGTVTYYIDSEIVYGTKLPSEVFSRFESEEFGFNFPGDGLWTGFFPWAKTANGKSVLIDNLCVVPVTFDIVVDEIYIEDDHLKLIINKPDNYVSLNVYCADYHKDGRLKRIIYRPLEIMPSVDFYSIDISDFSSYNIENAKYFIWKNDLSPVARLEGGALETAFAILGDSAHFRKTRVFMGGNSPPQIVARDGKSGWLCLPDAEDNKMCYLHVDVDDEYLYNLQKGENVEIEIEYYDEYFAPTTYSSFLKDYIDVGRRFAVEYDSATQGYEEAVFVACEGDNRWKKHKFLLQDGRFYNRTNGVDFRIALVSNSMARSPSGVVIRSVKIIPQGTMSHINISASTGKTGNIFFAGESIDWSVKFNNGGRYLNLSKDYGWYDLDVRYSAIDEDGNTIWTAEKTLKNIKPGQDLFDDVSFFVDKYGLYKLHVEAENKSLGICSKRDVEFSYCRLNHQDMRNQRLGVCGVISDASLLAKAGFGWAKAGYPVSSIIQSDGSFRMYPGGAEMFQSLHENRIYTVTQLSNEGKTVDFAVGKPATPSTTEHTPRSANGLDYFKSYCAFLAQQLWGGQSPYIGNYFETWNEFDGYWQATNPDRRPHSDYAGIVKATSDGVKSVNPNAKIAAPASAGNGLSLLSAVFNANAGGYIDFCAIHMYDWGKSPKEGTRNIMSNIAATRDLLNSNGRSDVPIWVTETGWASGVYGINEKQQGYYLVQAYAMFQENNLVDKMFIYTLADTGNVIGEREKNFGLVKSDKALVPYAAKPAFLMMSNLNATLAGAQLVENTAVNNGKTYVYRFSRDENDVLLMWTIAGKDSVSLDLGVESVTVYDAYGNSKAIGAESGVINIELTEAPIYVEGRFSSFGIN